MKAKSLHTLLLLLILMACKNEQSSETSKPTPLVEEKEPMQMYQMSEMAAYMEQMYAAHQQMKQQILDGEEITELSFDLENLHSAAFTDPKDYDAFFKTWANRFKQYEIQMIENPEQAQHYYNQAIQACISCHEVKCAGPLPRIKKLIIKP